jgi:hypothetical protein
MAARALRDGEDVVTLDLYKVLQVDPEADAEVIEAAYRRLARRYHPDVNPGPDASARMREINEAYRTLRWPRARAVYDHERARRRPAWLLTPDPELISCHIHPGESAVEFCDGCYKGLCRACAERFRPPTCPACVVRWARRRQLAAVVTLMAIAMVVAAVGGLAVWLASRDGGVPRLGVGRLSADPAAVAAVVCSLVIAALIGRAVWDLRRLRQLVAEAIAAG